VGAPNGSTEVAVSELGHEAILGAMSDGSGIVALLERSGGDPPQVSVLLYDRSGAPLGSYKGALTQATEQLTGFIVTDQSGDHDGRGEVVAIDEHGNVTGSTGLVHRIFNIAPYGLGGVVAVGYDGGGSPGTVTWFDEAVRPRWQTSLPRSGFAMSDREGNTLVLLALTPAGNGHIDGVWIDRDGNAGNVFDAGDYQSPIVLYPRVGSGIFLAAPVGFVFDERWIAQFDPFGGPTPAPDWLASRPAGTSLHMARNGRAYAVIAPRAQTTGPCSTKIDIVAPSGKSCGTAEFPSVPVNDRCESAMWVGYDGTAIQQFGSTTTSGFSGFLAQFRWWTGFLR
jgi:hypothetical protein